MSLRQAASHGLSGRGQTSLRCGRSRRDEEVQVFLLCLQGNADEDSGRSSQYIYILLCIYCAVQVKPHSSDLKDTLAAAAI